MQQPKVRLDRNNTNFTLQLLEYFRGLKWGDEYSFLKYYQNLVREYISGVDIDARGVLVQHEMGLGKSILAVSIALDLIHERQPIILLTKSLQENMRGSIKKYVRLRKAVEPDYNLGLMSESSLDDWIASNFSFVSMNASNMLKQMGKAAEGSVTEEFDVVMEKNFGEVLKFASLDGKLLIVDEAHNLFRAITNGSKNALGLYDLVMKSRNLRIVFLTGTPIANDPFELVPCFNMLGSRVGHPIFPEDYREFNKLFVDPTTGCIKNREKFQNRIQGLVSKVTHNSEPGKAFGVTGNTHVEFPEEKPLSVERVHMDPDQYVAYGLARDKEKDESSGKYGRRGDPAPMTKPKSNAASTYRVKSRQLSNFCPPPRYRDSKDPSEIPAESLSSAKYRRAYENILAHDGELGLVYSQFVSVGGLGTFARYLESQGWQPAEVFGKKSTVPDTVETGYVLGGHAYRIHGSGIPPIDVIMEIERELEKLPRTTKWLSKETFTQPMHHIDPIGDYACGGVIDDNDIDDNDIDDVDDVDQAESDTTTDTSITEFLDVPSYALSYTYDPLELDEYQRTHNCEINGGNTLVLRDDVGIRGYFRVEDGVVSHAHIRAPPGTKTTLRRIASDAVAGRYTGGSVTSDGVTMDISGARPHKAPGRVRKYAVISGSIPVEERDAIKDMFNSPENAHGGIIDLILVSSTGAEGLDLNNIRHIHVLEPYWNWSRVKQIIARGVRNDSHKSLPVEEKNVHPYIYLAIPPESERLPDGSYPPTTDTELYDESLAGEVSIESFLSAVEEVVIECLVNGEANCRACNPTNKPLYSDDVAKDVRSRDPCTTVSESRIVAHEVVVDGVKYYYVEDATRIYDYRVFVYDPTINGYKPVAESDPKFLAIIDAIAQAGQSPAETAESQ